jgi:hypothetical protein
MVSLTNCFTSMFAGIVVFSVIGDYEFQLCISRAGIKLQANKATFCDGMVLGVTTHHPYDFTFF